MFITPPRGLKLSCVHPAGFHLQPGVRAPARTQIHKIIFPVSVVNPMQCNAMLTNTAVEHMLCIQKQYERYLTYKMVKCDTFTPPQDLVKVSN